MKKGIFIIGLTITSFIVKAQNKVVVKIILEDTLISCKKNFALRYMISNNTSEALKFPFPIVFLSSDAADLVYSIEKYNDSAKKYLYYQTSIDDMAYREVKFTKIEPSKSISGYESFNCNFIEIGKYRIRLKLNSSRFNKNLPNYYSQWANFTVTEPFKFVEKGN